MLTFKENTESYVPNQVMVKFSPKISEEKISRYHRGINGEVIEENEVLRFQIIRSSLSVEDMVKYYQEIKEVEYINPNFICKIAIL